MVDLDISTENILENILQIGQKIHTYYLLSISEISEITALLRHCIVGKFILKTYLVSELSAPRERNGQLQTNKSLCCKI